jgi:Zn-dependent metalloprotease
VKRLATIGAIAAVTAAGLSAAPSGAAIATAPAASRQLVTKADPHFTPKERAAVLREARADARDTARTLRLPASQSLHPTDALADTNGAVHIRYDRTYRGLRVIGGDLVVHQRPSGKVKSVDYASQANVALRSIHPRTGAPAKRSHIVVFAARHRAVLAWETHTIGTTRRGGPISRLTYTNANTGRRITSWSTVDTADGTGNSLYSGTVPLKTVLSGSTYQLIDQTRGSSAIYDANNSTGTGRGTLFTDSDNVWGNGSTTSRQSAAVDAAYGAANTWDFYKNTFGRNGIRNDGVAAYSRVHYGRNYENAFWDDSCFCMTYGDGGSTFSPLVSLDVAGHEMSHGVTSNTAGLVYSGESGGLNESTSDIFGTMVEFTANNASDPGDYYIGEEIARDGTYLRRMDHPSLDGASADCWSSGVGNLNVHYSSGVGNHFFYLLAEGSGAKTIGGRSHNSPTCNGSSVTGIGRDAAARIWYRALTTYMTSTTNYKGARDAAIKAARDLYGATSTQCNTVVSAMNAVSVPVGAETCSGSNPPPPGGNLLLNPGFESGNVNWSATSGVIGTGSGYQPRTGAYNAWLDGYGTTHTDTLSQTITIPSGKSTASLGFYLWITTQERGSTVYDTLRVQAIRNGVTTTLATYSNANAGSGYVLRTLSLNSYIGQTVTLRFTGTEDSSLATSFRIDDTSVTTT